jgi:hypothetical protein
LLQINNPVTLASTTTNQPLLVSIHTKRDAPGDREIDTTPAMIADLLAETHEVMLFLRVSEARKCALTAKSPAT